jgi:hypothetical protein
MIDGQLNLEARGETARPEMVATVVVVQSHVLHGFASVFLVSSAPH